MIPVYEPFLGEEEAELVQSCLAKGWISGNGAYVEAFEDAFAGRCGRAHGVAVTSGTAALHLALHALDLVPGDEVLVPTLTYVATAHAVSYTGAIPVFVDAEADTWNMSPTDAARKITSRTRAILVVHLFGHPAQMDALQALADHHGLLIIEDAAQAHFAKIGPRVVGSFGQAAAFSFYGNKLITTGEGGMVLCDDEQLANRLRLLRNHAMAPERRYWHTELGFNYRMTNLQAAVGLAQMGKVDDILARKAEITTCYRQLLGGIPGITLPPQLPGYTNIHWLFSILVEPGYGRSRDQLMESLYAHGVETRPFFPVLHRMPRYSQTAQLPLAEALSERGLSLPSSPLLTIDDINKIAVLIESLSRADSS